MKNSKNEFFNTPFFCFSFRMASCVIAGRTSLMRCPADDAGQAPYAMSGPRRSVMLAGPQSCHAGNDSEEKKTVGLFLRDNHTVVAVASGVDDAGAVGYIITEHKEAVPEQIHL